MSVILVEWSSREIARKKHIDTVAVLTGDALVAAGELHLAQMSDQQYTQELFNKISALRPHIPTEEDFVFKDGSYEGLCVDIGGTEVQLQAVKLPSGATIFKLDPMEHAAGKAGAEVLGAFLAAQGRVHKIGTPQSLKSGYMVESAAQRAWDAYGEQDGRVVTFTKHKQLTDQEKKRLEISGYLLVVYAPITAQTEIQYLGLPPEEHAFLLSVFFDESGSFLPNAKFPLLDDVISSGATITAMRQLILEVMQTQRPETTMEEVIKATPALAVAVEGVVANQEAPNTSVENAYYAVILPVVLPQN